MSYKHNSSSFLRAGRYLNLTISPTYIKPMTSTLLYVLIFSYFSLRICTANDSITTENPLRDGETIVSGDGTFKLAFFGSPNSTDRYVGIWYNKVSVMKVVWVANRNNPLNDSSGILKISEGNLQVLNGRKEILWRTNVTHRASNFSRAQLSDSGSLLLLSSFNTILWQSIDHPTDTFLQKMSVTFNKDTYKTPLLHSWRSQSSTGMMLMAIGKFCGRTQKMSVVSTESVANLEAATIYKIQFVDV